MNQTYVDHQAYEWEGTYAYSSIVGWFLHLQVGIIISSHLRGVGMISLPISRREIDGYKVPSTYTTNFLGGLWMQDCCGHHKVQKMYKKITRC
jgi:hypothetical protein